MIVYHGTTTWKMHSLVSGIFDKNFMGLYVTDTPERAAMYANTQAKQEVTEQTFPLVSCAAVFAIEVGHEPRWYRRPESHCTLDKCETTIKSGKIVGVQIGRPGKLSYTEQRNVETLKQQLADVPVEILG